MAEGENGPLANSSQPAVVRFQRLRQKFVTLILVSGDVTFTLSKLLVRKQCYPTIGDYQLFASGLQSQSISQTAEGDSSRGREWAFSKQLTACSNSIPKTASKSL